MYSSCSTSTLQNFNPVDLVFAQILHILLLYIIPRPQCDVTSHPTCTNQNPEYLGKQGCHDNKTNTIPHHPESSCKRANKKIRVTYT